ncbi:ABC transporter ATP-binding protein [Rhodococcus sp. IEGM 1366]|uniref:ABC transporter ATP-binding protein n=1 Tax=Rhodococcus sp. IEGM 1366 TaxID=3082223 RepID=UPI002952E2E4|nr:ABC transporter ATP-binding protein [Rhodococcus sp. IEGM 1366]MDV8070669.1 ABC transporter ATP-binding protein [Rhodococcus sp. IEGM 1366]
MITSPPRLAVHGLSKTYGNSAPVLVDIEFDVQQGEFVCIVGPSGAGKTTLLRCLTGLMPPTSGEVVLDGKALSGTSPQISIVFQEYSRSLLPWMTVAKNVALPLKARKLDRNLRTSKVREALASVGLRGTEDKYPWQLSGGMQQRVAIARALITNPEVLVMDEPFASIDAQTRFELEDLTLRLQRDRQVTVLLVTHDIDEAVYLSDRIVVLSRNPASVVEIVDVQLGSARDQITTRETVQFSEHRSHILEVIRDVQLAANRNQNS